MHHARGITTQVTGDETLAPRARCPSSQLCPVMSRGAALNILLLTLVLLICNVIPIRAETRSPRVVSTKYGKLRGIIRELPNKYLRSVEVFLGVPYANPPIGSNRFSPTRTPNPWSGERYFAQYGPVCPQRLPELWDDNATRHIPRARLRHMRRLHNYLTNQAEDCLYLNVYVPSLGEYPL